MEPSTPSIPVTQTVNIVGRFLTLFFPKKVGETAAIRAITEQTHLENALRDKDILFPPGTPAEQMTSTVRAEITLALKKNENRNKVFEEFDSYFNEGIENLPPLREEVALPLFEYAGDCTTKEAQERWARLIAEECRNPGSISLQTLHTLRTMTNSDARIIEKYAPYTLEGIVFTLDSNPGDASIFEDMGLVSDMQRIINIKIKPLEFFIFTIENKKFILTNKAEENFILTGLQLTRVGQQIFSLTDVQPDKNLIFFTDTNITIEPLTSEEQTETCTRLHTTIAWGGLEAR